MKASFSIKKSSSTLFLYFRQYKQTENIGELPRLISSENVVCQDLRRNPGYSPSKFHLENTYIGEEVGVMWNYTYLKNQGLITRSGKKSTTNIQALVLQITATLTRQERSFRRLQSKMTAFQQRKYYHEAPA